MEKFIVVLTEKAKQDISLHFINVLVTKLLKEK